MEPSIPQLCEGLTSSATAPDTLQVLFNMALTRPTPLADHTDHLTATADNFPKTSLLCIQVMSAIAKAKQVYIYTYLRNHIKYIFVIVLSPIEKKIMYLFPLFLLLNANA